MAAELAQEIAAHAIKQVIVLERGLLADGVDQRQREGGALRHRDGDGAIEFDHRGGGGATEQSVKRGDLGPVGILGLARAGVAGGNGSLDGVGTQATIEPLGAQQALESAPDHQLVPHRPVLVGQQDGLALGIGAGAGAGMLQFHQCQETMDLWLFGHQTRQNAAHAHRLFTELRAHPVFPGSGRIPFVEDEVEHAQHRGEPVLPFLAARHFEGHAGLGNGALGAHDALADGGVVGKKGAGDFLGSQAADQAQGERYTAFGGKHGMTGCEDQPQQVIADIVVQLLMKGGFGVRHLVLQEATDLLQLGAGHLAMAK